MEQTLVIIPTYNERETLPRLIEAVLSRPGFDLLVVDDGSPDGTGQFVSELMTTEKRLFLIERRGKQGLGTAYVQGFKWGLGRGYSFFVEMDADGSHDPAALPGMVRKAAKGCGLVIGSRYLHGTISVVGWDFYRLLLSKSGNFYASRMLGLKLTDLTSGFRCYSRKAMERLDLDEIHSNGYGFQIEMAFRVAAAGLPIGELPIIFYERESGASKMSGAIIREAAALPWRLRLGRLRHYAEDARRGRIGFHLRTIIGLLTVLTALGGGAVMAGWLLTEGDIIEFIHQAKLGLPDWAWVTLKISLSVLASAAFVGLLIALAIGLFSGGSLMSEPSDRRDNE